MLDPTDPIRFGPSNMLSFSPLGTATPGTFYLAGETLQAGVRVTAGSCARAPHDLPRAGLERCCERRPAGAGRAARVRGVLRAGTGAPPPFDAGASRWCCA